MEELEWTKETSEPTECYWMQSDIGRDRGRYIRGSQGCRKPEDRPTISTDRTVRKEENTTKESRVLSTFLKPFYISQQGPQNPQENKKVLVNKKKKKILYYSGCGPSNFNPIL